MNGLIHFSWSFWRDYNMEFVKWKILQWFQGRFLQLGHWRGWDGSIANHSLGQSEHRVDTYWGKHISFAFIKLKCYFQTNKVNVTELIDYMAGNGYKATAMPPFDHMFVKQWFNVEVKCLFCTYTCILNPLRTKSVKH